MTLEEALEQGGASRAGGIEKIGSLGKVQPVPQQRQAILSFRDHVQGWEDVVNIVREAHAALKSRHQRGREELSEFLRSMDNKECIRAAFAPAIGGGELAKQTCSQPCLNGTKLPASSRLSRVDIVSLVRNLPIQLMVIVVFCGLIKRGQSDCKDNPRKPRRLASW